jgi:hypothetical protein
MEKSVENQSPFEAENFHMEDGSVFSSGKRGQSAYKNGSFTNVFSMQCN